MVDNTVGADWDNVQLALVAGAPQSFIQPLSQPLYVKRPEIPIATNEPIITIQTGKFVGKLNESNKPVSAAEPSVMVIIPFKINR